MKLNGNIYIEIMMIFFIIIADFMNYKLTKNAFRTNIPRQVIGRWDLKLIYIIRKTFNQIKDIFMYLILELC